VVSSLRPVASHGLALVVALARCLSGGYFCFVAHRLRTAGRNDTWLLLSAASVSIRDRPVLLSAAAAAARSGLFGKPPQFPAGGVSLLACSAASPEPPTEPLSLVFVGMIPLAPPRSSPSSWLPHPIKTWRDSSTHLRVRCCLCWLWGASVSLWHCGCG